MASSTIQLENLSTRVRFVKVTSSHYLKAVTKLKQQIIFAGEKGTDSDSFDFEQKTTVNAVCVADFNRSAISIFLCIFSTLSPYSLFYQTQVQISNVFTIYVRFLVTINIKQSRVLIFHIPLVFFVV